MTVSAPVKFTPKPPALVESKNAKIFLFVWNSLTMSLLSAIFVEPSILKQEQRLLAMYSSRISIILVIWQKIRTLWSFFFNSFSSSSNFFSFEQSLMSFSNEGSSISAKPSYLQNKSDKTPFSIILSMYSSEDLYN